MRAAAAVVALVSIGAGGGTTTTTPSTGAAVAPRLTLVTHNAYVTAGRDLTLCVRVRGVADPSEAEIAVTTYERLITRTDFRRTLEGRLRLSLRTEVTPVADLALPCGPNAFYLPAVQPPRNGREGVYPVRVELRDIADPRVLSSFVTHLIYVPTLPVATPVSAAIVIPVHDAPALQAGGARHLAHADELAALAAALHAVPGVPLVLDPTPETLDALAAAGDDGEAAIVALRESLSGRQVLGGPYVPLDLPALLDAQLGDEADAQFSAGSDAVAQRLLGAGLRPDARTWVVRDPIDDEALTNLRGRGYDRLVVPPENLDELPTDLPLDERSRPFRVPGRSGSEQEAFVADPNLAGHFAGGDQVLRAHHLLAEMSFVYFEAPNEDPRGLVAVAPRDWRPNRAFLQALLQGLQGNPVVRAATLDTLFTEVPPARDGRAPLERELVASPDDTAYESGALRSTRTRLNGFASVVAPDNELPDQLRDRVLVSQSIDLTAGRDRSYLRAVDAVIKDQVDRIKLPTGRTITLTAREGEIPISFRNETGYRVRVRVRVESEKLLVKDAERDLELVRLNTTERFSVQARTSGDSALTIVLESPDRTLAINQTLLRVRSTAASGVGIVLSAGAAIFLVVWWGRDIRRRRRSRRAGEAPGRGG
jgi:hypothetical protein